MLESEQHVLSGRALPLAAAVANAVYNARGVRVGAREREREREYLIAPHKLPYRLP
jgi:CO/xanthine dehydrogenase Mo-binding subunit